jgi:hypothetical protein
MMDGGQIMNYDAMIQIDGHIEEMESGNQNKDEDESISLHKWTDFRISISFFEVTDFYDSIYEGYRVGALELFFNINDFPNINLAPTFSPESFCFNFYINQVKTNFELNLWTNDDGFWDNNDMSAYDTLIATCTNPPLIDHTITSKEKGKAVWTHLIQQGFSVIHNDKFNLWKDAGSNYYKKQKLQTRWGTSL